MKSPSAKIPKLSLRQTRNIGWLLLFSAAAGVVAPAGAQVADSTVSPPQVADEPLAPGDAIRLSFWREPELSGEFQIDEAGNVVLPLLGTRNITGVPAIQLKGRLTQEYDQQLVNQEVQIMLLRRVRVLGAVNTPGLYHVDGTMTLGDAIALAGGARPDGKLRHIRIFRDGNEVYSDLDVSSMIADQIHSGDQINVPLKSWIARNTGPIVAATITAIGIIIAAAR